MKATLPRFAAGCLDQVSPVLPAGGAQPPHASSHDDLRAVAAFTDHPPTSARLPFSYRYIPAWVRDVVGAGIGRGVRRRLARQPFPAWPLDLSADLLEDLASPRRAMAPTPVMLTHDLDTAEGLRNLVDLFLPIEEAAGARSANYIVPFAWPIDHALLSRVHARGHEVGIHGFDHSNRTPFLSAAMIEDRLDATADLRARYDVVGYRAPSLLRTRRLLESLAGRFTYDSSIPTSGGAFPTRENGCASARLFVIGGIREVPLSLPRDGSLRFLGHTSSEIGAMWRSCAVKISESGGLVVLLTHCEKRFSGNAEMLAVYADFLQWVSEDRRFTFTRPRDLTVSG